MRLFLAVLVVLFLASSAFAVSSSDGKLAIGTKSEGAGDELEIGLSPKVVAEYYPDGSPAADEESQWFSIATVHPGGNEAYATAQNVNNIFKAKYETGSATATILQSIPQSKASETDWTGSDSDWNM